MTFSVCRRLETSEGIAFGIGVATDAPAVGALAPYVTRRGAICTQSFVNVRLGRRGVKLLSDLAVDDALRGLLAQDDRSDLRQVHGVDARGDAYAFSGENCEGWFGHRVDEENGITVAGNMLENGGTLAAVADVLREGGGADTEGETGTEPETVIDGNFSERLIDALEAGKEAGGDKRGHTSAAISVWAPETTAYHDLRVDHHETPIRELRRVHSATKARSDEFGENSKSRIFD